MLKDLTTVREMGRDQTTGSVGASSNNERGPKTQADPQNSEKIGSLGENVAQRRSKRKNQAPKRYGDYAMATTELKGEVPIPSSYKEVINGERYGKQWEQAIHENCRRTKPLILGL